MRAANKRKLTDWRVENAKARHGAYLIWDTVQKGLGLRVQPTGNRSWVFVYQYNRKARWLTLGAGVGVKAARLLAAEAMLEVLRGKDPAAKKKSAPWRHFPH